MSTVLVFGTFDGLHPGHDFFLSEAKKLGDRLVVCLARDAVVEELKKHPVRYPEIERREKLAEHAAVDEVIYGDRELGTYAILEHVNPDVIALGYDQSALKIDLEQHLARSGKKTKIEVIPGHEPERYKSSLL